MEKLLILIDEHKEAIESLKKDIEENKPNGNDGILTEIEKQLIIVQYEYALEIHEQIVREFTDLLKTWSEENGK